MAEPPPTSTNTPDPVPPPLILHRNTTLSSAFTAAVWRGVFNQRRDDPAEPSQPPSQPLSQPPSSTPSPQSRLPLAVVRATHPSHAREAVLLARSLGPHVRVSVRSGGHSWAAWSVRRDAVLLDLGGLMDDGEAAITYEEATGVVACPPSCTGRALNGYLAGGRRMFAGGHCPDVGLGGFLLQGGMGWNCKNWGWACEYVIGVDVVTADARELHCSETENDDLFWAARGAGPGFPAIVTRFYLKTLPRYEMYQSLYLYPISVYRSVLQFVVDANKTADADTEVVAVASYVPAGSDTLTILANFTTFKHSRAEAEAALRPLHDDPRRPRPASVISEVFCRPDSLEREYADQECASPPGHRYCCDNAYIAEGEDVVAVLEEAFTTLPAGTKTFSLYYGMSPTSRRGPPGTAPSPAGSRAGGPGMALSMQTDHYSALYGIWAGREDDERCVSWVRRVMGAVERHEAGSYLGDADFRARRTKFWSAESGARLMEVRRRWDPEGRVCGFLLDEGDGCGTEGLRNVFEWADERGGDAGGVAGGGRGDDVNRGLRGKGAKG